MNKKILLFTNIIDRGGASTYFIRINKAFNKFGINSSLLCFKDEVEKTTYSEKRNIFLDIKHLRENIKKDKVNTIITNYGIETMIAKLSSLFLKEKVKIISVIHIRSIMWIPNNQNKIKKYILKSLIKLSFRLCNKCIAVSNGLREEIIKEKWINKGKIVTIYNPVIDDEIKVDIKEIKNQSEIHLAIIGWIWDIKNQIEVIEALYKLNDKRYKLHIIGGIKDKDYYSKLKNKVNLLNLDSEVIFEGIKEDIFSEFKNIDILLLSSKTEALPTVIIEAMATGTPVIATDCDFGPEELLSKDNGLIYEKNNINQLVEMIKILSKDKKLYRKISENGMEKSNEFRYKNIVGKYKKII